jgi:hypothetical protein
MASLEKRIKVLEVTRVPVVAPRIRDHLRQPSAWHRQHEALEWQHGRAQDDETEAQFLARVEQLEPPHAQVLKRVWPRWKRLPPMWTSRP